MMKKIISSILVLCMAISICACGKDSAREITGKVVQEEKEKAFGKKEEGKVKIVKSGKVTDALVENNGVITELISWDLGYSAYNGKPYLCMKYHIINNSNETIKIGDYCFTDIFVDGVEINGYQAQDFYGDGVASAVYSGSSLRPNSETDYYQFIDYNVDESHKVEVDIFGDSGVAATGVIEIK